MFDVYHSVFHHSYPLSCALSLSLFCRLLCSQEINKDKLFKFWRLCRAAFKVAFFFHDNFFSYLEKVSFLLEKTFWKTFCWVFSSPANLYLQCCRGNKMPILRPEGLWCLECFEERSCQRVALLWIQSKSSTFVCSFWKHSCNLSKGCLESRKNLLYDT